VRFQGPKVQVQDRKTGKPGVFFCLADIQNFICIRKAREDIEIKNQKLAQMEADYGDVVPRRDYERLNERFQMLEKDLEKVRKDQEMLMKEHRYRFAKPLQ
jgi:hypothetical protein